MNRGGDGSRIFFVIGFSVLVAVLLSILPLPSWASWFRPSWLALVVIYWSMSLPLRFGIGAAWMSGLVLDIVSGTLLGEHALALSIIAYFVIKFQIMRQFTPFQRTLIAFGLLFLYQIMLFLLQGITGQIPATWLFWVPPLISILFWPWIYSLLKSYQRRFRIIDPRLRGLSSSR
jgi:rod shape-determining protein MreD